MKKLLTLAFFVAAFAFSATFVSAQNYPQNDRNDRNRYEQRNDRNWRNNRVRVVTRTRIVRQGRRVYRETIQIRYLPNGRTQTRVISRVRIR